MEEINMKELAKFFLSKINIILLITLIFFIGGFIYINFILTPMYHGSTTLILVSDNHNESSATIQNEVALNKNLVTTYSEIVKSRSVLQNVIHELDLKTTVKELSKSISVTSVENTEIIKIQVSNKNNKVARDIADTTANVFKKEVQKIYNLTNVSIIDQAYIEKSPYNINLTKQLTIMLLIGILVGGVVVFLIFYFDTSIKSPNDIEEKLGLSVIGNVVLVTNHKEKTRKRRRG